MGVKVKGVGENLLAPLDWAGQALFGAVFSCKVSFNISFVWIRVTAASAMPDESTTFTHDLSNEIISHNHALVQVVTSSVRVLKMEKRLAANDHRRQLLALSLAISRVRLLNLFLRWHRAWFDLIVR